MHGNSRVDGREGANTQLALPCMGTGHAAPDPVHSHNPPDMLRYAIIFLVLALIAGFLGFAGIALAVAGIAKILFYIFVALLLFSLISHFMKAA